MNQNHLFIFGFYLEVLAEFWNQAVIDQYPIIASYVPPTTLLMPDDASEEWKSIHVRQS